MSAKFQFDVFLSHNAKDKPRVRRLAQRLKSAGLRVWFDEWTVRSGDIIALKVDEGLEQSRVLLMCVSRNALASGWVALERSTAIHRDPANDDRRFVPLLLSDCDLPDTLRRYKYVDFRDEAEVAFAEILEVCRPEAAEALSLVQKPTRAKDKQRQERLREIEPLAVLERELLGHKDWVCSVAVSPDGKWAASGSHDKTVRIWNLENGECQATLDGHTDEVNSVAITLDGMRVLSGSKTIRFESGRRVTGGLRLVGTRARMVFGLLCRCLTGNESLPLGLVMTRHSRSGTFLPRNVLPLCADTQPR